jgi:hypothetical protein
VLVSPNKLHDRNAEDIIPQLKKFLKAKKISIKIAHVK